MRRGEHDHRAVPNDIAAAMSGELTVRHGPAAHRDRPVVHARSSDHSDATIAALGKLSEALEVVEHARGLLYGFHRLCGTADLTLQDAVRALRDAGHADHADDIETVLVGRDIVPGCWSFELVEAYDKTYWSVFRDVATTARRHLGDAEPHVYEAEMKRQEQTPRRG